MVVRAIQANEATCRWFSGETLREKSFYSFEISLAHGDLTERLARARERIRARERENESMQADAREVLFALARAKEAGEPLPEYLREIAERLDGKRGTDR